MLNIVRNRSLLVIHFDSVYLSSSDCKFIIIASANQKNLDYL